MAIDTEAKRRLVLRGYSGITTPAATGNPLASSLMLMGVGMSVYGISVLIGYLVGM